MTLIVLLVEDILLRSLNMTQREVGETILTKFEKMKDERKMYRRNPDRIQMQYEHG